MTRFGFTKLVVADLEKMAAFYSRVYGLREFDRIQADIGIDPIDEILMGVDSPHGPGSIMLLKFTDRPAPEPGAVILGFVTDDLRGVVERVVASGGSVHADIKDSSERNVRVAFVRDPEGNLAEVVQVMG